MFVLSHALFDFVKNIHISKLLVNRYLENELETFDLFEKQ